MKQLTVVLFLVAFAMTSGIAFADEASTASAWINAVYTQYSSYFGTPITAVQTQTSSDGTYYVRWFLNSSGTTLGIIAWIDGYIYYWDGSATHNLGLMWSQYAAASSKIKGVLYTYYFSIIDCTSSITAVQTQTSTSGTYYVQWYSDFCLNTTLGLIAWTDGYIYYWDGSATHNTSVKWK